jgi:hypothetical protein
MRAEGLLEEKGVQCRMFAPTALWNAPSIARLTHIRIWLATVPAAACSLTWRQGELTVQGPAEIKTFVLPEELEGDLGPLLAWFQGKRLTSSPP